MHIKFDEISNAGSKIESKDINKLQQNLKLSNSSDISNFIDLYLF